MKIHEAQLGIDRQRRRIRRLRSHTGGVGSVFARTICAQGAGVACALWVSSGWAQDPAPPEPPAEEPPAASEAPAPAPEPPAAPGADAPVGDTGVVDDPALDMPIDGEPLPEDVEDVSPSGQVDEVIVTVDRRKKDLQDYSGTASAFTESQLRNLGVTNITQMSQVVPGVQIGQNDQGSSTIFIRGVGSDNTTE